MNRRLFTLISLLGLAAFARWRGPSHPVFFLPPLASDPAVVTRELVGLFSDPGSAEHIGRRYLALYPDRADLHSLLHELGPQLTATASRHDPLLRDHVSDQQRQDFARGDTVLIDNWILSRTEASLCALATIS